ncbi:2'-5' RNA ligase family protein [Streptomonospora nanhaiensis]|uniref:2'-5' RNA ligase family protein n=1 Tax=Streptomonospora nanhaiensis TaxID=1323731 RepID=UPI001C99465A|nr:2'-5' RNA ligase family protein [Streptomonospora nanhaiensis]MBX9387323.1 2'-5' RNA ligase family protein [Streptomonospora nanhaiensis]
MPDDGTYSRDHWWWRPGWGIGTRYYAFHITFTEQPGGPVLHQLAQRLRPVVERDGYDPIPQPWLHLTMQGLGHTRDVPDAERDRIAAAAHRRLARFGVLGLEAGPAAVDAEAIHLPVALTPDLDGVRTAVRDAISEVRGPQALAEPPGWAPHVSLAYANTTGLPLDPVRADLAHHPSTVRVAVDHVSLIEMHRDNRMYEWQEVARLPFN